MLDFVDKAGDFDVRVRPRFRISYDAVGSLLAGCDAIVIVIACIAGAGGYQFALGHSLGDAKELAGLGLIASLAYGLCARQLGLYELQNLLRPRHDYLRIILSTMFVLLVLTLSLFLLKVGSDFSRGSVVCFVITAPCMLVAWRSFAKRRLRGALLEGAVSGRRAILLGTIAELAFLSPDKLLLEFGVDEVSRIIVPDRRDDLPGSVVELAAVQAAADTAREVDAHELLLCIPWNNKSQLELMRERLRVLPLPVRLLPDRSIRAIWELEKANNRSPLLVNVQAAPLNAFERNIKRAFDLVVASFSLLVLAPLMLLTAILLKLESREPIIFRQHRKGFNGREFRIYKFRTMRVLENGPAIVQATRNDPRVTRLGRVLRRNSIDELPQLFNVLKGEMSIIGPRPHAVAHDDEYGDLISRYAYRRHVRPGITGWAQVNGFRGETPRLQQMQQRVQLDLWYIDNWSPGLDLQILARTCFEVVRGRNSY